MLLVRVIVRILKIIKGLIFFRKSFKLTKTHVPQLNFQVMEAKKLISEHKELEPFLNQLKLRLVESGTFGTSLS